jgi:hypothetical protein
MMYGNTRYRHTLEPSAVQLRISFPLEICGGKGVFRGAEMWTGRVSHFPNYQIPCGEDQV